MCLVTIYDPTPRIAIPLSLWILRSPPPPSNGAVWVRRSSLGGFFLTLITRCLCQGLEYARSVEQEEALWVVAAKNANRSSLFQFTFWRRGGGHAPRRISAPWGTNEEVFQYRSCYDSRSEPRNPCAGAHLEAHEGWGKRSSGAQALAQDVFFFLFKP
ncbi:hypothetical protein DFJ77DRAFT_244154 [Powellomyces hirtus]|nr:hypothetical protein DFJ77DRAFT_244154 [Powellomyces hirtus]